MRTRFAGPCVAAGLALAVLTGCGDDVTGVAIGDPAAPSATMPSPTAEVSIVDEQDAELQLWVSNQSFIDDDVRITVTVDGVQLVDRPFAVEGQHNWILFPVALEPGRHELVAVSGTGVELRVIFRIPKQGLRYAVLDYWNYRDDEQGRHFTWQIQKQPLAFA